MSREQVELLHEQASEHYLEGDFGAARNAWASLLAIAPEDERAQEGLRLCKQYEGTVSSAMNEPGTADDVLDELGLELDGLADGGQTAEPSNGPARAALDPSIFEELEDPTPAAESAPLAEVDGLESMLIDHEGDDSAAASAATAPPAGEAPSLGPPSPDRQNEGIDVGDVAEIPSLDLDPAPFPDRSGADANDAVPPPVPAHDRDEATEAVDLELDRRVEELLDDVRQAVADGRDADALAVLSRIAILDEGNSVALALEAEIRTRRGQVVDAIEDAISEGLLWMESGRLEDARARFVEVLETAPDHQEARHFLEDAEARIAAAGDGSVPGAAADVDLDLMPADGDGGGASPFDNDPANIDLPPGDDDVASLATAPGAPAPRPEAGVKPKPKPRLRARRSARSSGPVRRPRAAVIGIAALALAAACAWFGVDLFRGGARGATAAPGSGEDRATAPEADEKTTAELIKQADRLAAVITGDPSSRDASDVTAARLRDAQEAMADANWKQAVLAFNDVLERDPGNAEAAAGFLEAGKAYRERKAQDEEYDRAMRAFAAGDYASALRVLYRLPRDLRPEDVRRGKIEGWYNLGLIALRAGNVHEAAGHFREVLAIDANDGPAGKGLAFAERYRSLPRDGDYYAEVERMRFRGPVS